MKSLFENRIGRVVLLALALCAPLASAQDNPLNLRRTIAVEVVEKTKDAVVYISSSRIVQEQVVDPFWHFDLGTRSAIRGSLGSGFIVHSSGYIITNNHVIDRAREIKVTLLDG